MEKELLLSFKIWLKIRLLIENPRLNNKKSSSLSKKFRETNAEQKSTNIWSYRQLDPTLLVSQICTRLIFVIVFRSPRL
jgi:hypothetical protein